LESGLSSYREAVSIDPSFQSGADIEDIKNKYPEFLPLLAVYFGNTNQEMHPVPVHVRTIVEELYAPTREGNKVVWIKTVNELSFAVIYCTGRAIVFDSHKNAISLIVGKEELVEFLTAELAPRLENDMDLNAFSYAMGHVRRVVCY
jgi:hypothetical protein